MCVCVYIYQTLEVQMREQPLGVSAYAIEGGFIRVEKKGTKDNPFNFSFYEVKLQSSVSLSHWPFFVFWF